MFDVRVLRVQVSIVYNPILESQMEKKMEHKMEREVPVVYGVLGLVGT